MKPPILKSLLSVSVAVSLIATNLLPATFAATEARGPIKGEAKRCCCGTDDARCCGTACCATQAPSEPKKSAPPENRQTRFERLLLGWLGLSALTIDGQCVIFSSSDRQNADLSPATSSLQARHIRLNT